MMVTRTPATMSSYARRGDQLWKRAKSELKPESGEITPFEFLEWFKSLLFTLSPASRRQYINAVRQYLEIKLSKIAASGNHDAVNEFTKVIIIANDITGEDFKGREREINTLKRTSKQKSKSLPDKDLSELYIAIKRSRSRWARLSFIWLYSIRLTGLRPAEWRGARLITEGCCPYLLVLNGKCTNRRSNGPSRQLILRNLSNNEIELLRAQVRLSRFFSTSDETWQKYQDNARKVLHEITRKLWPNKSRYPTLYSGRHQVKSDAKEAGLSDVEIAALLGHFSLESARRHYGEHGTGVTGIAVRPSTEDVQRIVDRGTQERQISNHGLAATYRSRSS